MMYVPIRAVEPNITASFLGQCERDEYILNLYFVSSRLRTTLAFCDSLESETNTKSETPWNFKRELIDTLLANDMFSVHVTYPKASKRLEMFKAMRLHWDIEEDTPASNETIDLAYKILSRLKNVAEQSNVALPEPYVYLTSDGWIEFEWDFNGKEFDLAIAEENSFVTYSSLVRPSADPNTWVDDEKKVLPNEVAQLPSVQIFLSWL